MHASALLGSLIGEREPQTTAVKESSLGRFEAGVDKFSKAVCSNLSWNHGCFSKINIIAPKKKNATNKPLINFFMFFSSCLVLPRYS